MVAVFCLGKAWQFKKWPFKVRRAGPGGGSWQAGWISWRRAAAAAAAALQRVHCGRPACGQRCGTLAV